MNEIKLKPCPFCGGKAKIDDYTESLMFLQEITYFFIRCSECCCEFSSNIKNLHYQSNYKEITNKMKQELAEKWNRRAENETD